jgi:TPR repeat protein
MKLTLSCAAACILLMLSFAAPAAAGPLEDAATAHSSGDYATALRLIRPLADQGNATAQSMMGILYSTGKGVTQSYIEAAEWYRLAANQGLASAQYNLGSLYGNGQGVPQNYTEAMKWYHLAGDQGDAKAQFNLGAMYAVGQGAPKDLVRALVWLNLSAAQGAQEAVAIRDAIKKGATPAQIAEAQKLAREWKPTKQQAQ